MKKIKVVNFLLGIAIVSMPVFFLYKFKESERKNKDSNLRMDYYVETVDLMNRINGREVLLNELSDCSLNNYMQSRKDRFHFAIIVRPGGCAPCIDKSIAFYHQHVQDIGLDSLIIGCFENKRHPQVWYWDRITTEFFGYLLTNQPIYFSENPYFVVMKGNKIISSAIWHPDYEDFSKEQIKRTIAYYYKK